MRIVIASSSKIFHFYWVYVPGFIGSLSPLFRDLPFFPKSRLALQFLAEILGIVPASEVSLNHVLSLFHIALNCRIVLLVRISSFD